MPEDTCDFSSRFFAPNFGIDEDPVTGSAHAQLAPYWSDKLGESKLRARQLSTRGGELVCEVVGQRILISGKAIKYMQGEIVVPITPGNESSTQPHKVAYTTLLHYSSHMFDRCLYFNVNTLARLVNKKWTQAFVQYDLSPAHGYMLRAVLAQPGISQKQLANELKLAKSTITRFVDALQKKVW